MKGFIIFTLISIFIILSSCSKEVEDCINAILETTSLEQEYNCINTKYQMEVDLSESFTIIRSQNSFDDLISGSCKPQIDFELYDLLVGKKGLTSGNVSIDYLLKLDCEESNLQLFVTFNQNITTEAPNLTYHALVPKMDAEQGINVTIEVKY